MDSLFRAVKLKRLRGGCRSVVWKKFCWSLGRTQRENQSFGKPIGKPGGKEGQKNPPTGGNAMEHNFLNGDGVGGIGFFKCIMWMQQGLLVEHCGWSEKGRVSRRKEQRSEKRVSSRESVGQEKKDVTRGKGGGKRKGRKKMGEGREIPRKSSKRGKHR